MATEEKEVRISYTSVQILCTKSVGGAPSVMHTPIASVGINKGLASTEQDLVPNTHIQPFTACEYMGQCMVCVPAGRWSKTAESTVNVVKRIPLVEDSEFECTARGGKITFNFDPVKAAPPPDKKPNIVDNAKAKINSTANTAVKKATQATQKVTARMTGALDGVKPVLENTQVANLANSLDNQLQELNKLKKQGDTRVKELEQEITELKNKIEARLTGKEYTPPKEEETETEIVTTMHKDEIDLQNAEEEKLHNELYEKETDNAIKEYEHYINSQITPVVTVKEVPIEKQTNIETPKEQSVTDTQKESTTATTVPNSLETLIDSSKGIGLDKNKDTQEALKLLRNLDTLLLKDASNSAKEKADVVIQNERTTLNSKVQAKIDEELKELGYFEKLKKYNAESGELQEDMDKASLALKSIGNFGGFIDGLKNKYLGKIGTKYSKSLNQFSQNLSTLNTSMDGMSYAVDGFPKGEVFTKVKREIKEDDDKDNDGNNGNIFGSLEDVLNDRNEEPKILRIYAIYAEDGESYQKDEIITTASIPPEIPVYLVIQSNGKANGEVVDLNLQGRTFHYRQAGKDKDDTDRIIENISLQGDSPDFEKGGQYDTNDPNYALESEKRRLLNDKTKIKFISRFPIEEEEEEELF